VAAASVRFNAGVAADPGYAGCQGLPGLQN
jgi:hypothetical protein